MSNFLFTSFQMDNWILSLSWLLLVVLLWQYRISACLSKTLFSCSLYKYLGVVLWDHLQHLGGSRVLIGVLETTSVLCSRAFLLLLRGPLGLVIKLGHTSPPQVLCWQTWSLSSPLICPLVLCFGAEGLPKWCWGGPGPLLVNLTN